MNPYEILGVSKDSSPAEIKSAYRKLLQKWHPDLNPNNIEEAEEKTKMINAAYEAIMKGKPFNYKSTSESAKQPDYSVEKARVKKIILSCEFISLYDEEMLINRLYVATTLSEINEIENFVKRKNDAIREQTIQQMVKKIYSLRYIEHKKYERLMKAAKTLSEIDKIFDDAAENSFAISQTIKRINNLRFLVSSEKQEYISYIEKCYDVDSAKYFYLQAQKINEERKKYFDEARPKLVSIFTNYKEVLEPSEFKEYLKRIDYCITKDDIKNLVDSLEKKLISIINGLEFIPDDVKREALEKVKVAHVVVDAVKLNEENKAIILPERERIKQLFVESGLFADTYLKQFLEMIDSSDSMEKLEALETILDLKRQAIKRSDSHTSVLNSFENILRQRLSNGKCSSELKLLISKILNRIMYLNSLNAFEEVYNAKNPIKVDNSLDESMKVDNIKDLIIDLGELRRPSELCFSLDKEKYHDAAIFEIDNFAKDVPIVSHEKMIA